MHSFYLTIAGVVCDSNSGKKLTVLKMTELLQVGAEKHSRTHFPYYCLRLKNVYLGASIPGRNENDSKNILGIFQISFKETSEIIDKTYVSKTKSQQNQFGSYDDDVV